MIKKELITRGDGATLYRTYSDTDHLIRNVCSGVIYDEAVDIGDGEEYEELEEYVELDGDVTYDNVLAMCDNIARASAQINRLHLTDNEALAVMEAYPHWEDRVGNTIEAGFITQYGDKLWKARQTHTALKAFPPSIDTASLYEVICIEHTGDKNDPIPYIIPMEVYEGKYYIEDGVAYRCTRNSGVALAYSLSALVGLYVEHVN